MDGATAAAWSAAGIATIAAGVSTWQSFYSRSAARGAQRQAKATEEQVALMWEQHVAGNEHRAEQSAAAVREAALLYLGQVKSFFEIVHRLRHYGRSDKREDIRPEDIRDVLYEQYLTAMHDSYEQILIAMHEGQAKARAANVFTYFPAADLLLGEMVTETRRIVDRMFSGQPFKPFSSAEGVSG